MTTCPYDGSENVVKFGHQSGKQMYWCMTCRRKFREGDAAYGMKYPLQRVNEVLTLYYNGMSFRNMMSTFDDLAGEPIPKMTLWRWVTYFSRLGNEYVKTLRPVLGTVWVADETAVDIWGQQWWFWDVIDYKTRFLIATHLSKQRSAEKAWTMFRQAQAVTSTRPKAIITDRLPAYGMALRHVFTQKRPETVHLESEGFRSEINTNLIERFHGTIKQRTKIMRGFKIPESASVILDGFTTTYNFLMHHSHLNDTPPAVLAGIGAGIKNWGDIIRLAMVKRGRYDLPTLSWPKVSKNPPYSNLVSQEWLVAKRMMIRAARRQIK